eukprot:ctg_466.g251
MHRGRSPDTFRRLVHMTFRKLKKIERPTPADIDIAQSVAPLPIDEVAAAAGIASSELELYGPHKAKVRLQLLERLADAPDGHLVVVTGITPTRFGEGKSTTTVGLSQALGAHAGQRVFTCVRQPSQGPTFGIKGGAAGGGYAQVIPMEEFNLHLTGDLHAITAANNLLAAALDARMFHEATQSDEALYRRLTEKPFSLVMRRRLAKLGIDKTEAVALSPEERRRFARLDIDPDTIAVRRVLDVNDRFLRGIRVGMAETERGHQRDTGFDITVASEIMAILALTTSLSDMRERLGRIVVAAQRGTGEPITADDLGVSGALTVLMRDAIMPNLMQTLEGTPCVGGPHGAQAGRRRRLRAHRGWFRGGYRFREVCAHQVSRVRVSTGGGGTGGDAAGARDARRTGGRRRALHRGAEPLPGRHRRGVADRRGRGGAGRGGDARLQRAAPAGVSHAVPVGDEFARQGAGDCAGDLPRQGGDVRPRGGTQTGVVRVARLRPPAICVAKTQYSFSHDPARFGAPTDFVLPIRDVRLSAGAEFVYPLVGSIQTIPGLPTRPAFYDIDLDPMSGRIVGMS